MIILNDLEKADIIAELDELTTTAMELLEDNDVTNTNDENLLKIKEYFDSIYDLIEKENR